MAITRAQAFQQLVRKPSGEERPGYRGDDAYGGNSGNSAAVGGGGDGNRQSYSAQATQSGPKRGAIGFGNRDGRDPTVSLTEDPVTTAQRAREIIALGNVKRGLGDRMNFPDMFPTAKAALNLIKVRDGTFMDQARKDFNKELGPEEEEETGGDGGTNPFILPQYMMPAPSITEQEPEEKLTELQRMLRDRGDVGRRFKADGGIMNEDIIGGEFDFESARQMYGLGKLVKKATRAVKKVASSPIGKAAIAYTLTGGLGNLAQGQRFFTGFTSPGTFLGGAGKIFSREGLRNIAFGMPGSRELVGTMPSGKPLFKTIAGSSGLIGSGGQFSALKGITAASILPLLGLGTGDESEEEAQAIIDNSGIDPAAIREAYLSDKQYLARRFRAEGGPAEGKEPVAKKVMPLLDMGGMEKDYREEGGFVPIGRMEKADDVPARLSKNEFVFTADAVRNAGDGDIDKGAEVMYNMMKHLEDGGDVSEESQGLEGARNMFQTSQRLEEVL